MEYLRLLYRFPWLLLHLLLGTPVTVLCHYRPFRNITLGSKTLMERTAAWWSRNLCRIFGLRLHVRGEVEPGPQLFVANHISWIDIPLMGSVALLGFVSKAEIEKWPVIGYLARVGGTVFHLRGSHDSASGVASQMVGRLRAGGNVAIFPEGGILPGHDVKRFHGRLFAAAIETACPVQPVMLRYLRGGQHDPGMSFLPGEHFVANFFRLLRQAPCRAEVHLLPRLESEGRQRRPLAADAERAVREAFDAEPLDA
ncbi:MAG: 1-acyl-sn-glycerol-3-phosphate acyltransferase [Xanthomonadales bacterium]|nr:1-acyl-sn-glycerol-3-phosphate acyltransferase [Gammaproteobacteria bacterium]MBT8049681.1 1-acyl-sn-glycerol-3-phosphate acyltransferase [Gammaproteobacteria bacterium]MBT8055347.1 1-acyl-sn-glycerol-3-phosphate acyltransferase [Gammaproteobacteria bacterium]NNJ79735.1 1-acyl-sn-glycerol-3-phosphate acyltransferase [Xanthomonadales bacterium]NNL05303.1 1-acyl-sn-glycerol-3-phosphate acyltransferase [Xanthomonadales bacterium]